MSNFLSKIKHVILKRHVYGWSSSLRVLPDLIVIGVVRSGTTSLYHYLSQHPSIIKSAYGYKKDTKYFCMRLKPLLKAILG